MTRVSFIFILIALAGTSYSQQVESSEIFDIIFKEDFEDNTTGIYNYEEYTQDWNYPLWSDPIREYWISNGQILIVDEGGNKILRNEIKEGEAGTDETHGMQWWSPLGASYNELYFSYRLKFKPDFMPVLSGKLPGIKGGEAPAVDNPPDYDDGFMHMLTWDQFPEIGYDLSNYIYHHDQTGQSGQPFSIGYGLPTGVWMTITFRVVMNTITDGYGNQDGLFETFIDGVLRSQITNLRFRNLEEIGIDQLLITNFFGGDQTPKWAAVRDEYVDFDDFFAFTYKPEVDVPRGHELSAPDRVLILPNEVYNDSVWRKSLTAHAVSSKTINLEWKNYFYPVSYTIQRKTQPDAAFEDIATVSYSHNTYKDGDLSPNTTYYYRVKLENSVTDDVAATTLTPSPPQAPGSLVSLLTEKVLVKIGWNDNSTNELGFILERSKNSPDNFTQIATIDHNVTAFTNSSLTPNTSYYYRIKAYNEDGQSDYSNVLMITTLQLLLPAAPSDLDASSITKNSFILGWKDNSNNESGFQIYKLDESSGTFKFNKSVGANIVQLTVQDLQPNTSYTYMVRAYNDDGISSFTNEINVTTLPLQPPVAPITLISDTITPSSVYLRWTDRSNNETGFQIFRSLAETSGFQLINTTSSNKNTYISNNLDQGTSYFYRVRAFNDDGVSAYTNTLNIITPNPPISPTGLVLKSQTKSSVTFEWTDNSDNESGFYLERSVNVTNQFVRTDTLEANTKEYTDQNLESNTSYYYRLAAFNSEGSSVYSDTLIVHWDQPILPPSPSAVKLLSITPFSAIISWDDNSYNETGFQIQRAALNSNFTNLSEVDLDIIQYNDTLLDQNSTYFYRIRAFNQEGYSIFSDTLEIHTPKNIIPPAPDSFKTDLIRYNKIVLSWIVDTTHITGFEIERTSSNSNNYEIIARTGVISKYSDTLVVEGTEYHYRIRSFNAYNYSSYSPAVEVTVPFLILPEPPELLSPVDIESNSIAIKWTDKSTDESGFIVRRAIYPQNDFQELSVTGPDDTLFVDKTVIPNTTYYYLVNSVNENGQSKNSNQLRVSSLSLAEVARYREGLIAYYNFSLNSDSIVHDLSKFGSPLDLLIEDTMSIAWRENSRLEIINNAMIHSKHPATKIIDACKKTNEITLECWIKPTLTDFNNDATIISLSRDPDNISISLMQSDYSFSENKNYKYLLGLNTKSTEPSGRPFLSTDESDIITMHHIVYTRNYMGEEKLYLNGTMVANSIKPLGFDNWKNDYYLYLGNESTAEKPWMGVYYLIAIYEVALTADQISQNYEAGPTDNIRFPKNAYDIKLFPNPSTGRINFDIKPLEFGDFGERVTLQLIDLNGFVHLEEVIHDSNQSYFKEFDLSYLKKGIYYFRLISPTDTDTKKIVLF